MPITWAHHYLSKQANIEIQGLIITSNQEFHEYISSEFPERIRYYSGIAGLENYLHNLRDTGFQTDGLEGELSQRISKSDWGEYFAYHQLENNFNIAIPWPSHWDKKKSTHSLPGADVIGLKYDNSSVTFVFGEVKTSEENQHPPQVVTKTSDGLITQIMKFNDRKIICNLIQWLFYKSTGKAWESDFDTALKYYLVHDHYFSSVGILVRDTEPTIDDLSCVIERLTIRFKVTLYAFYLPVPLHECIRTSIPGDFAYAGY
jgi:hypothetical protein